MIDKVGALVGGLTYGAKKTTGNELLEIALKLNPDSAITRIEYANALVMMFGKARTVSYTHLDVYKRQLPASP